MIFTFYSYKGGVGRSMAVANVAVWLFARGLRVVVVDWDLEAPGIESFFFNEADADTARASTGLIDLLVSYKRAFPQIASTLKDAAPSKPGGRLDDLDRRIRVLESSLPSLQHTMLTVRGEIGAGDKPCLSLLPAGWRGPDRFKQYAKSVQQFDWEGFYSSFEGDAYFEWLRRELTKLGDVVLIDARTGVTEMGGVCTRQLADVVVCLCAPNAQNLDGVSAMAESFKSEKLAELRGRRLETLMVPSRVDMTSTLKNRFQQGFSDRLARYVPDALRFAKVDQWDLRIPYITEYAYNEQLAVGVDGTDKELEESYKRLSAALALSAPPGTPLRVRLQDEVARHFGKGLPDVFVEHMGSAAFDGAQRIRAALDAAGISLWPESSGSTAFEPAGRRWEGARALVLVLSDGGAEVGTRIREEWTAAREQGLWVCPVFVSEKPLSDFIAGLGLPRWMSEVQWSTPADAERVASGLRVLPRAVRAPRALPPLPTPYVVRPEEMGVLKTLLLEKRETSSSESRNIVGLWGPAGIGKSTLARAVCRDPEIADRYHDGMAWLGPIRDGQTNRALREVLLAFLGDAAADLRDEELPREASRVLRSLSCLIVLDEVDDAAVARSVAHAAPSGVVLVTTRDRRLTYALGAQELAVGGFRDDEAAAILGPVLGEGAARGARDLAPLVGNAPIALALVSQELRKRTVAGDSPESALASLTAAFKESGTAAIDRAGSSDPETSVAAGLDLTLERLSADERERLRQLLTLPEPLVLGQIAREWGIPAGDAELLTRRFCDLALVSLTPATKTVRVDPLVRLVMANDHSRRSADAGPATTPEPVVLPAPVMSPFPAGGVTLPPPEKRSRGALRWIGAGAIVLPLAIALPLLVRAPRPESGADAGSGPVATSSASGNARLVGDGWQASEAIDAGDQAAASGDDRKASELYSVAIYALPDASLPYIKRGESYLHQGRFEDAIVDLTTAIRLSPDSASLYVDRGRADTKVNDLDAAFDDFSSAIRLNGDLADAYYQRGLLLKDAGAADFFQAAASPTADQNTVDAAISRLAALSPGSLPKVVVQTAAGADSPVATKIIAGLRAKKFEVSGPETRERELVKPGGEVRYFFAEDTSAALMVKRAVESSAASQGIVLNLQPSRVRDQYWVAKATPGRIEVWFPRLVHASKD